MINIMNVVEVKSYHFKPDIDNDNYKVELEVDIEATKELSSSYRVLHGRKFVI